MFLSINCKYAPPADDNIAIISTIGEMFEASVDGDLYDPERWGNFYRPSGVQINTSNSAPNNGGSVTPPAPTPAPEPVAETVTDTGWKEPETVAAAPAASDGDKPSAQDILAAIRNRK